MACSEVAFLQTAWAHYNLFQIFSSQCQSSLVFAARQIANNLSPIAKNFWLFFLVLRIISLKKSLIIYLMPSSSFNAFLCTFCEAQNRSFKPKFNLKRIRTEYFCKKTQNFLRFFAKILLLFFLTPHPWPPSTFWKFFIRCIEQWTKTFCKKTIDRAGQKPVDRSGLRAGQPA